jgi:hypothetical protein
MSKWKPLQRTGLRHLAALLLLIAAVPAGAATQPTACSNWIDPASIGDAHYDLTDVEAHYFATLINPGTAPARIRIDGAYPDARNFSLTAYKGTGPLVDQLTDYQIQPGPGSQSAFIDKVHIDPTVAPGGHYTVYLQFTAKPSQPAPNTLYLDPAKLKGFFSMIVYRIYLPAGGAAQGGVALPRMTVETPSGNYPSQAYPICRAWGGITQYASLPFEDLLTASGIFAFFPSDTPYFFVYRTLPGNFLEALNGDIGYLALIRGLAPTYTTQPGVEPQVRHWSICENSLGFLTYACVEDYKATLDDGGYYNIVISPPDRKPPAATPANGFDWMSYGSNPVPPEAAVIYRQQLAADDYLRSIARVKTGIPAAWTMGDYFPQITYCSRSVFDAHTAAHDSPASVFAACAAGR